MKHPLLLGLFLVGWAPSAWSQVQQSTTSALPTLRRHSLQHIDPVSATGPVTLDLQHEGRTYLLDLEPHSMRSPDFRVLVDDGISRREVQAPPPATYRGTVHDINGDPLAEARVAAARTAKGWVMSVSLPGLGDTLLVQPASELDPVLDTPGLHVVYASRDVQNTQAFCKNESDGEDAPAASDVYQEVEDGAGEPEVLAATGQISARIAFDTDFEYYELLGSSVPAVIFDIESQMVLVEDVFERDARVAFEITTIVVRSDGAGRDPYSQNSADGLLSQMSAHWNTSQGGIQRSMAHLMTGRIFGGAPGASASNGVFFGGLICKPFQAYSVSRPYFTTNVALRTALTCHHLAHIFGAKHCDGGIGETPKRCFIMCSVLNGCDGIGKPTFGSPARGVINRNASVSGCNPTEPAPIALPFVEDFPSDPPSKAKWFFNDLADVVARPNTAEPSEPAALKLNANKDAPGYQDDIRTVWIDASGATALNLSFYTQRRGVEAGEQLVIEYTANGVPGWTELTRLTSDGTNEDVFHPESIDLPDDARHRDLRLRFRIEANQFDDRWFLDDIVLDEPASLTSGPTNAGAPVELQATGAFPGSPVAFYYSFAGAEPGYVAQAGDLHLGLTQPVGLLQVVRADERGRAVASFFAPAGTPATELFVQAVRLRPLTGRSVLSDVLPLRIEPELVGDVAGTTLSGR